MYKEAGEDYEQSPNFYIHLRAFRHKSFLDKKLSLKHKILMHSIK